MGGGAIGSPAFRCRSLGVGRMESGRLAGGSAGGTAEAAAKTTASHLRTATCPAVSRAPWFACFDSMLVSRARLRRVITFLMCTLCSSLHSSYPFAFSCEICCCLMGLGGSVAPGL